MVLLILAVVWAAVLIPPWLRNRADARPADSISAFRSRLAVLQRTGPAGTRRAAFIASRPDVQGFVPARPRVTSSLHASTARARTQKRRRDIFVGLLAAMGTSLVLGLIPGLRILWVVHLIFDALFAAYVGLLVHMRNQAAEQEMKVRFLPRRSRALEPALLLRRTGN